MNSKRSFGVFLTALGIGGLIYTTIIFANTMGEIADITKIIIYDVLGILFFISGISLASTMNDKS